MGQTSGMRVNWSGFGDEQCTGGTSPLGIVLDGKVTVDVVLVGPEPGHWTEDDTVLEVHTTDTDRLKEFRHGRHSDNGGCRSVRLKEIGEISWAPFSTLYMFGVP